MRFLCHFKNTAFIFPDRQENHCTWLKNGTKLLLTFMSVEYCPSIPAPVCLLEQGMSRQKTRCSQTRVINGPGNGYKKQAREASQNLIKAHPRAAGAMVSRNIRAEDEPCAVAVEQQSETVLWGGITYATVSSQEFITILQCGIQARNQVIKKCVAGRCSAICQMLVLEF